MLAAAMALLGGIGLFLFGMQAMTDGLRALASPRLRQVLGRFTTSPLTGVATGAATTAVVQSSSATVMTVIGFVGAGVMTFPQALGVIFGANIGTTATGWMVALIGVRLDLGILAQPLLLAGALLGLLGRGARRHLGQMLAGFSLVFIGFDVMTAAVPLVSPALDAALALAQGPGGPLLLVLVGAGVTAVLQSSSLGVAMTLAFLAQGSVDISQAAALVIGMDVGTTAKSVLATLGGSVAMRRTAAAHVGYNLVTAVIAFAALGAVPALLRATGNDPATTLVAFHTLFNLVGALLLVPVAGPVARLIERMVPARGGALPEPLARDLLDTPAAALDAAEANARHLAALALSVLARQLRATVAVSADAALPGAIEDLQDFLLDIAPGPHPEDRRRLAALLHMADHLDRILNRIAQADRAARLHDDTDLARAARALAAALERPEAAAGPARLSRLQPLIALRCDRVRRALLDRDRHPGWDPEALFALSDAARWLDRTARHAERIEHYGRAARPLPSSALPGPGGPGRDAEAAR